MLIKNSMCLFFPASLTVRLGMRLFLINRPGTVQGRSGMSLLSFSFPARTTLESPWYDVALRWSRVVWHTSGRIYYRNLDCGKQLIFQGLFLEATSHNYSAVFRFNSIIFCVLYIPFFLLLFLAFYRTDWKLHSTFFSLIWKV